MMAQDYSQKFQKLTTQEIYNKAIHLAMELNYKAAIETMEQEANFYSKEAIRDDLILFLTKREKLDEGNLIMHLTT